MLDDDKKRYKMKNGGPGIEALRKEAPEVVERMGFQEGGDILDKRLKAIARYSSGYLYYVSLKGITGSSLLSYQPIKKRVNRIKKLSNNKIPVTVGFGIKTPVAARKISMCCDGIIIGSSIVELIDKNRKNKAVMHKKINNFVKSIKSSLVN